LNVRISKFSMYELMMLAFQVKGHQLSGPDWMVTERYDIQAKLPEGGRRGQVPAMMQTLLAERFGMRTHRENRDLNILALVPAKGGPRLAEAPAEESAGPSGQIRGGIAVDASGTASTIGQGRNVQLAPAPGGNIHITAKKTSMAGLVDAIARYCELPLINMTGIEGTYDMELDVSAAEVRAAARSHGVSVGPEPTDGASDPAGVSLPRSLEKLGLKLEARKAPVEVIVIDRIDKVPTEN